ncbi:MAG: tetratricopeptide repeat protein [Bacteroidota bacterium]
MIKKLRLTVSLAMLAAMLLSCAVTSKNKELTDDARRAFEMNDYQAALASYEQIIASGKGITGDIWNKAGIAAWEVGQTEKAIDYLERAKKQNAADAKGFFTLAKAYRKIDNLSREIVNLKFCVELNESELLPQARATLFDAYVRSENWNLADSLWNTLTPNYQGDINFKTGYLIVNRKLKNDSKAELLAKEILKVDRNNTEALEFLGEYYFNRADELYVSEMNAYEKNKTTKQYKQLTEALKRVNADYKASRDYFEALYKLKPEKKYARYLGNIYTRFENKQKADYWYKLAK